MPDVRPSCLALLLVAFLPSFGAAQETVAPAPGAGQALSVRAAGMGGAFTAIADDGSAAAWNPAGLASGAFFSLVLDRNMFDTTEGTLIGLGTPPLGVFYYRTAAGEDGGATLVAHHAGVTLVQSLGSELAIGASLKAVRGVVSGQSSTRFDADLGVMATGSLGKIGLSVRNLRRPSFDAPGGQIRLQRRVRLGVSVKLRQDTAVAADVDLTKEATARGEWRDVAFGVESHVARKLWLRSGVHFNAAGGAAGASPVASAGASYAIYGATLADTQATFGSKDGNRGWGIGLRFVF
jgi:hypothetical protein